MSGKNDEISPSVTSISDLFKEFDAVNTLLKSNSEMINANPSYWTNFAFNTFGESLYKSLDQADAWPRDMDLSNSSQSEHPNNAQQNFSQPLSQQNLVSPNDEGKEKESMQIPGTAEGLSKLLATHGLNIKPREIFAKGKDAIKEGLNDGLGRKNLRTLTKAVISAQGWLGCGIDNNPLKLQIFINANQFTSRHIASIKQKGVPKEKLPEKFKMLETNKELSQWERLYQKHIAEERKKGHRNNYPFIAEAYHAGLNRQDAINLVLIAKSTVKPKAYKTAMDAVICYHSDEKQGRLQVVLPDPPRSRSELLAILEKNRAFTEQCKEAHLAKQRTPGEAVCKKRARLPQEEAEANQSGRAKKFRGI